MVVQKMKFTCSCEGRVTPLVVGVTRHKQMYILGICQDCDTKVQIVEPIANMLQHSLQLNNTTEPDTDEIDYVEPKVQDTQFLKNMGILE